MTIKWIKTPLGYRSEGHRFNIVRYESPTRFALTDWLQHSGPTPYERLSQAKDRAEERAVGAGDIRGEG
jgi:hypothetical protein|tara:strand:+ start:1273 stop:1479 length:207 start_codon:yes stop_codon:yes gene_type:complete